MNCKKIMVVDDDEILREGLAEALECEGYDVDCACNGREALDKLSDMPEDELPGCIFLDIRMPVMDGMAFLEEKEQEESDLSEIPVCITSANYDLSVADEHHSVVEKIGKPLDLDLIYRSAHKYCGDPHQLS